MKVCFLLQRNFAYLGHSLAILLKEKYGIDQFCGYVYMRSSYDFLKSQKEINYTNLILDEDLHEKYKNEKLDKEYLKWLEKEFGIPNLWPYIMPDRVVISNQLVREYPYDKSPYSYEEILRIVQVTAKAIIEFLDKEKPDFIFFTIVGAIGARLLFQIAKKKGIKTIVELTPMIKDKIALSDTYDSLSDIDAALKNKKEPTAENKTRAKEFLNGFRNTPFPHYEPAHPAKQPVSRSKQFKFLFPGNLAKNIVSLGKSFYEHYTKNERCDYDYIGPWNYLKDVFKRKIRNLIGVNDLYDQFNPREDYVFFPLHYEPEISLSLYSPFFTDQISVIQYVARSLPVGYFLYVKEHPMMVAYRPRSYYKKLKKMPNVKLMNPAITSFEIIPGAKLITEIAGSVGWEASLLKKPVITIGNVFYNSLSFVKNCKIPEQLPWTVKEQLENFKFNENELERFIALLFEESTDVNFQYLWEQETDMQKRKAGLEPLADLLMKKITSK